MKKLVKEQLNENMGYKTFLGKDISHENVLKDRIHSLIINIIMEEREISEKSFKLYDEVIEEVKNICETNPEIYDEAEQYYKNNRRLQYLAEKIYENYFK